ncbi:MAG: hypothetical protein QOJ75_149 [Chloroflexota bacterium]|nr:hypothetical protein [Chloroflexota bacterium]
MSGRARAIVVAAVVAVVVLSAAGAVLLGAAGSSGTNQPSDAQSAVGVIVGVDSAGLDKVSGFTLRTGAGESLDFDLRALENGAQFAPGHLVEHQATGNPVRVWFRIENGVRLAIRLEDAT